MIMPYILPIPPINWLLSIYGHISTRQIFRRPESDESYTAVLSKLPPSTLSITKQLLGFLIFLSSDRRPRAQ